jgi:fibronectin type 3 domain-containing protein
MILSATNWLAQRKKMMIKEELLVKKSKFIRLSLTALLILQSFLCFPIQASAAISAPVLTKVAASETEIRLSWDAIPDATGYELYRSDNDGAYARIVNDAVYEYTDSTVTANNKYKYYVLAKNDNESPTVFSVESNFITVFTDFTAPATPANLSAPSENITVTSVYLTWDASTDAGSGLSKYKIYSRSGGGGSYSLVASPTVIYYSHQNLTPSTNYYYYVTAIDNSDNESPSQDNVIAVITVADTSAPAAPSGLSATAVSETGINLTWNEPSDNVGVVSYIVYRSAANANSSFTEYTSTPKSYSFTGLTSSATYYFKVKAKDASGNISDFSSIVSSATQSDTQNPTAPLIWGQATSSTRIELTWTGATDNKGIAAYEVYRATGSGSFSWIAADTASPYSNSSLSSNTTYKYYIKTRDTSGNISDASNTVTVETNGDTTSPSKPSNLNVSLRNDTEARLTWDASTDNKTVYGYKIYRALESGAFTWIYTTSSTSYTNSGLTNSKTYKYYIKAFDKAGNESDVSEIKSIYTSTAARTDTETVSSSSTGTLSISGLLRLDIPSNAYTKTIDYEVTTKNFSSYSTSGYETFGQPVDITAEAGTTDVTSFNKELTLTFYYTADELGDVDTDQLSIYYWDEDIDVWVAVDSTVSTSSKKVTAEIDHLTVFAVLADDTAPAVPKLTNSSTSTSTLVSLTGTAENNSTLEISVNGDSITVTAGADGKFTKQVTLINGENLIKLRAEDAVGNKSAWSSTYTITVGAAVPTGLTDITGHWAQANILRVVELGIASGYNDRTFKPNKTITRAEFCKFVVSGLGYSAISNPELNFADNSSMPSWAKGFVARAVQKNIISGYNDNTFRPNKEITRQEMVSILIRAKNLESQAVAAKDKTLTFKDAGQIQSWARGAVIVAAEKGLLRGYSDNTFGALRKATRAEAVTMIIKMREI